MRFLIALGALVPCLFAANPANEEAPCVVVIRINFVPNGTCAVDFDSKTDGHGEFGLAAR